MAQCNNGHESTWDDYCSECGVAMAGGEASAPQAASTTGPTGGAEASPGLACPNCSVGYADGDVFCENCGYDFLTGSLPDEQPALTQQPASGQQPAASPPSEGGAEVPPTIAPLGVAVVALDADYFAMMSADGGLAFPDPTPPPAEVPLTANEVLIGRESRSRGIHPDIDLSYFGEDPGASARHAMIRVDDTGAWTVEDLGSTNGTYLTRDGAALAEGTPVPIEPGTPFYVGAWTSITITLP